MTASFRISIFCGAIPAVFGSAIFIAWAMAPLPVFQIAGFILILTGATLFVIGFASLWLHARLARQAGLLRQKPIRRAAALLLVNLPLCALYVFIWVAVHSADFVLIRNATALPIKNLILTDSSGNTFPLRSVPSGAERTSCSRFRGEGAVKYSFSIGDKQRSGLLSGYVGGSTHFELYLTQGFETEVLQTARPSSMREYVNHCLIG